MSEENGALWTHLAAPAPDLSPLQGARNADLLVIGGGFLGLSSALHAAEAGLSVVLIEAQGPGFGASGRNTGFVVPSLKSALGPAEVEAALGQPHSERLLRLVAGSGDAVFGLIDRFGMDVATARNGWLQPGHSAQAEAMLKGRLPALRAAGVAVDFLDRNEMLALTGLPALHGGLRVASGGQINPLSYARELARACVSTGVALHCDSPALRLERQGGQWRAETPGGSVTAPRVLLATNAMIGGLEPRMRDTIVPVKVYQVATQPLPTALRQRILPACAPVADTRRHTFALRWTEDNRLITGGMVAPLPGRHGLARRGFLARLRAFIPDCPPLRAEHVWTGTIAATLDALPRVTELAPGLVGVIGCNGRGVALTTALGRDLGPWLAGASDAEALPLQVTPPRPIPMARLSGLGPHLWLPWSSLRDRLDSRST
ncbi:NAD(P)/FAD-dependent oxidoreductase [Alloyangia pacifica]|uniref:Glycine/D-amino acid oxidase n=1 Tax=Alloyangia pacifica TaxID=311180 RepID=A0A1I6UYZ6_9RHOB|nr:FAD-dependent oxidoreductase [Alloyangia pacifica]SDI31368.1 Glycine/D-amino acid oxidase [Alloyangia pacifica]SFT06653.1 Glycine/D-amino acid oxidase [Alloyangia pacifica]